MVEMNNYLKISFMLYFENIIIFLIGMILRIFVNYNTLIIVLMQWELIIVQMYIVYLQNKDFRKELKSNGRKIN